MDVTRILSRQPLARGAAFYISCLPTDPIVTTGSDGTHPRDGTTVHLSKNASQLLLAARRGPHRPLNRQERRFYSSATASQSSVCNFGRFFSKLFRRFSQPPIRALPQPCREPARSPGPRGTPGVCSIRANCRSDESARVSGLATSPPLDRPIVSIAAAPLNVKQAAVFLRNRHGFSPGVSLHRSYKPYGSYRT